MRVYVVAAFISFFATHALANCRSIGGYYNINCAKCTNYQCGDRAGTHCEDGSGQYCQYTHHGDTEDDGGSVFCKSWNGRVNHDCEDGEPGGDYVM